eukprot:Platyproteum_vivax@DN8782_c0_g1_i1.p1
MTPKKEEVVVVEPDVEEATATKEKELEPPEIKTMQTEPLLQVQSPQDVKIVLDQKNSLNVVLEVKRRRSARPGSVRPLPNDKKETKRRETLKVPNRSSKEGIASPSRKSSFLKPAASPVSTPRPKAPTTPRPKSALKQTSKTLPKDKKKKKKKKKKYSALI